VRFITALIALMMVGSASSATPRATRIHVDKSDRKLLVYSNERLIATYRVALGRSPAGHKTQEGDKKTPEGRYVLDYKNPNSAYFLSIHVSYPNSSDRRQARKRGVSPGGDIMIHGQPGDVVFRKFLQAYPRYDWTDGCIALSDADMKALWDMVKVPVTIEITP
jgi:murein L,D-transpeptidase YafK